MQFTARRYDTLIPCTVTVAGDRITSLAQAAEPASGSEPLPWVAPGFVDLQINGYGGQEFSSPKLTPTSVGRICREIVTQGVTHFLPTVTTNSSEVILHALATIAQAWNDDPLTNSLVAGIHVEGPFISPHDGPRGAHPLTHVRAPDWNEFQRWQESAGGRIRLLTLSPEYDNAPAFIARAVASGVLISIGHTSASGDQIRAAVDAGASLCTHLGNGAHGVLPRHPNYIWDQLAEDRLTACLIADGHHLPDTVLKTAVRAKGADRTILVSDLSGLAGLPPGEYGSDLCRLEILPDGRLVIAGQRQLLAGASLPIGVSITTAMRAAGLTLQQAVDMASRNPARMIGLKEHSLEVGSQANLTIFRLSSDDRQGDAVPTALEIVATIIGGALSHGRLPN